MARGLNKISFAIGWGRLIKSSFIISGSFGVSTVPQYQPTQQQYADEVFFINKKKAEHLDAGMYEQHLA